MTFASFSRSAVNFDLPPSLRGAVFAGFLSLLLMATAWAAPAPRGRTTLDIYFVDVEGGQATLFVTPQGQSLLIDTGWPGTVAAMRIVSLLLQNWRASPSWILFSSRITTRI